MNQPVVAAGLTFCQFEKIFVLSMPERHDKRDALSLSASLSNIDFEWIDGVDGSSISRKSRPAQVGAFV